MFDCLKELITGAHITSAANKAKNPYTGGLPNGVIKYGSKGSDVKKLQKFLNWYFGTKVIDVDGIAGKQTVLWIRKFQDDTGISPVDGIFGAISKAKAKAIIKKYTPKEPAKKPAKKSKYYSDHVIIGQACCNEKGTLSGGKPGDQTGREVCTGNWYNGGWIYCFRAKDKETRLKLAQAMIDTCNNQHIGYNIDPPQRYAAWDNAEKNGHDIKGINTNGDTTCSQAVSMCMRAAGIPKKYAPRHCDIAALTKVMTNNNPYFTMYKSKAYTAASNKLQAGDILLSSHHTLIVVKSPNN